MKNNKYCLIIGGGFYCFEYYYYLISSFLVYNKWFEGDIVILQDDRTPLSNDKKKLLSNLYDKLILKNVNTNINKYDRIVYLDKANIIMSDISYLFNTKYDIIAFKSEQVFKSSVFSLKGVIASNKLLELIEKKKFNYSDICKFIDENNLKTKWYTTSENNGVEKYYNKLNKIEIYHFLKEPIDADGEICLDIHHKPMFEFYKHHLKYTQIPQKQEKIKNKNKILPFDGVYCIHLAEAEDRYEKFMKCFKKIGIENEVEIWWTVKRPISNFIGDNLSSIRHILYDGLRKTNPNLYGNVFNCAIEHYSIIKQAYNRGFETVMIMEDDISFGDEVEKLHKAIDKLPKNFDIVRFIYFRNDSPYSKEEYNKEFGDLIKNKSYNDYYVNLTGIHVASNECYLLSRSGMKKILDANKKDLLIADAPINNLVTYGLVLDKTFLNNHDSLLHYKSYISIT